MADMITFCYTILTDIADFLSPPSPMFYLFSLICGCFVVKLIKNIVSL